LVASNWDRVEKSCLGLKKKKKKKKNYNNNSNLRHSGSDPRSHNV
jgi:hypothetical protein